MQIRVVVNSKGVIDKETVSVVAMASKLKNYYFKTKSISVEIAGDIDFNTGLVPYSPNLSKWKNIQLKKMLEKLTGKETYVDNDANTASISAFWLDAHGKSSNLICITLGTGVGGGLIFNNVL
jgi:glucokinase